MNTMTATEFHTNFDKKLRKGAKFAVIVKWNVEEVEAEYLEAAERMERLVAAGSWTQEEADRVMEFHFDRLDTAHSDEAFVVSQHKAAKDAFSSLEKAAASTSHSFAQVVEITD